MIAMESKACEMADASVSDSELQSLGHLGSVMSIRREVLALSQAPDCAAVVDG